MAAKKRSVRSKKTTARVAVKKRATKTVRSRKVVRAKKTHNVVRAKRKAVISGEGRERLHRAKRALRALKHPIHAPKAVVHTHKVFFPERMLEEVPEQAMVEHWEAIGELRSKGVEVRHSNRPVPTPRMLREIELDAPISPHARLFASRHGLIVRERKHPLHSAIERIFG